MRGDPAAGWRGWLALLLGVPGRLLLVAGAVLGGITLLFFLFSAGAEVNMVGFLRLMGASVLLLFAGGALCIANLVLLLRPGDPGENAYGPPEPFPKGYTPPQPYSPPFLPAKARMAGKR